MKLPLSWLCEHVALKESVEGIAETLVRLGIEVESIERPRAGVKGVRIGKILSRERHPDADKLSLLKLDFGEGEPLSIVCGANNMGAGDRVPVATIGTVLPNGLTIKKGKIRGQESFGMCCSETELGLAAESAGLMILPDEAPLGAEIGEWLGLEEAIFELSITPNRGDCMSARGIARDLAAFYGLPLLERSGGRVQVQESIGTPQVRIEATGDCPLYLARRIEGVKVGASPAWLQQRLLQAGMRPVNGVVDVMNYLMLDLGQPMHAFDADKLSGDIVVRAASHHEEFAALDGREMKLHQGDLVVSDAGGVIALAGIMGSLSSGTTETTVNLLLESAIFRPARVSLSRRTHGMVSEASMRFERGIDPLMVEQALNLATGMIVELFGGAAGPLASSGAAPIATRTLRFPGARIAARLGVEVPPSLDAVLLRMDFDVQRKGGELIVEIPSHRHDVAIAEDLVEEYARVFGLDNIPEILPPLELAPAAASRHALALEQALQGGFTQSIGYAFISAAEQRLFAPDAEGDIVLANPISESMAIMRRSLFPSLLQTARHNLNRQQPRVALVELGRSYAEEKGTIVERDALGWLLTGEMTADEWYAPARNADFFDLKGAVEQWLQRMGQTARFVADDTIDGFQPGQSARIVIGRNNSGLIGRIDAAVAAFYDIEQPLYVAAVELAQLAPVKAVKFSPIPEFPSVSRDLVFLFDRSARSDEIVQAAMKAAGALMASARIFDRYDGKGVPEGKVSLGIRFTLQAADRTLTQTESDVATQAIVGEMEKRFGAMLRG